MIARIIVGVGQLAQERLMEWLGQDARLCGMRHYSPRIQNAENWQHVADDIAQIRHSVTSLGLYASGKRFDLSSNRPPTWKPNSYRLKDKLKAGPVKPVEATT